MDKYQKVAVHALIKKDGKFLFTHRSPVNDYKPNEWDLPGGTVEFGEEPLEALGREVTEETGLKIEEKKPLFVCSQEQKGRHQFWVVYECGYLSGEVKLNPEEHDKYLWAGVKEASDLEKIFFLDKFYKEVLNK